MSQATLFSVAGASLLGVLLIAAAASYLAPSSLSGSQSTSTGKSITSFVTLASTTNTLPCNQTYPLSLVGSLFFENSSGFYLFSRWNNCGQTTLGFLVTGQNIHVGITANGQTLNYTGFVDGGLESMAGPSQFGNLTQPFYFSSQVNSTGATALISSGTLTAINPSTEVALSAPQSFSGFGTVGYASNGPLLTTSSEVSTSIQNSTS